MIVRLIFILLFLSVHGQDKNLNNNVLINIETSSVKQRSLLTLDSALVVWNLDLKQNIKTSTQKFELVYKIAAIYNALGFKYKALEYFQKAEKIVENIHFNKNQDKANFYNELASFYYSISNNKSFKKYLIKSNEIYEKNPKLFAGELVINYEKIINNFIEYGDIRSAKLYLLKLQKLSVFFKDKSYISYQKFHLANNLYSLRIAIFENDYFLSENIYNKIDHFFKLTNFKKELLNYYADATNFYAEAIFRNGQPKKALEFLEQSINIHKKIDDKNSLVTVYSYYSYLSREIKKFDLAEQAIDEAIYLIEPNNFTDLSGLYINKGIIYFLEKKYAKSELYFDKAHELIKRIANTDFYLLSYNIEISKKYFEIYEKTKNKELLKKSFNSYKYSVKQFQDFYENDLFNPLLAEFKNNITEGLLNLSLKSESNLIETVELIENIQSKYLLKNFLLNTRISNEELINEISKIKTLKLKLTSSFSKKNEFKTTSIQNEIHSLEKRIIEKHPNFNSIFDPKFNGKEFIKNNSNDIIRYYTTNTSLFAIYLKNNKKISIKKIGEVSSIKKDISDLVFATKEKKDITKLSKKIFKYILKPFDLKTTELTIISNSFLNELPFEILIDGNGNYLVKNININYSNSLPLFEIQKNHKNSEEYKLAVFQPNYTNKKMAILPFAEKEAMFLQNKFKATLFSGENATKSSFIINASKFNVYHLSMHAIVDEGNEEISRLVFNDKDYYFSDFYSQNLPLDLVVLSACETGLGKYVDGEGLMSLSRAFTYSGVASTVHSLWEIPDKQAYEIVQLFYLNINKGYSKAEALQKAKVEYLKNCTANELKHPYYWSGFVLYGNSKALVSSKNNFLYVYLIGFLLLGIFLIVIVLKK